MGNYEIGKGNFYLLLSRRLNAENTLKNVKNGVYTEGILYEKI